MRPSAKTWRRVALWSALAVAAYLVNVEVQTRLGRSALDGTGLRVHSLAEGLASARSTDRLVLASYAAVWCPSCRTFDRRVLADPRVRAAIDSSYVFVRVDVESEEGPGFRERYDLDGFPRQVVLDAQGQLLRRLPVTFDPGEFLAALMASSAP